MRHTNRNLCYQGGAPMKNFWGFYDNGTYRVGCNGATVYIYDSMPILPISKYWSMINTRIHARINHGKFTDL